MAIMVKMGTKKADELIWDFNHKHYKGVSLFEVYDNPSHTKRASWRRICEEALDNNGWNLHMVGASCHMFSCIYAFEKDGNIVIRKFTKSNTYDLMLTPEEYDRVC